MREKNSPLRRPGAADVIRSLGLVDIHFHGAFGIDLMTAETPELDKLAVLLWEQGIGGFCPTTLSTSREDLLETVGRLGRWIRNRPAQAPGAVPLGIHLEGPFLNPQRAGAHPPGAIRPFDFEELHELWVKSQKTLKIITLAPETFPHAVLKDLCRWARNNKVILSLGHSQATEDQARLAFKTGMRGVTHAWNAMTFHQRSPGPLAAAFGHKDVYLELIADQIHVAPKILEWSLQLHAGLCCFVSDCAPAAATAEGNHPFGPLRASFRDGACRLADGSLAGGGLLLTDCFVRWLHHRAEIQGLLTRSQLLAELKRVTVFPMQALGIPAQRLAHRRLLWTAQRKSHGKLGLTWRHPSG